ncbi:cinnamoyl-CoA reductase [Aspergillus bombycis]|uniref:Cinnamoyl-CoA reductase n=1 Tax=Aspergillus bombycis TaxID=109264 RepID=A0A1F8AH04_9EURO|nr:cinnamoyl-CoA reductase [Aspergillus bombycis]OGM50578.1 cinnamoyl-CoA reductase [Aspergillus bombycis]
MAPLVLITGATGLIGFRVLLEALSNGYNVRFTARSKEKAEIVTSNPVILALSPGDRLSSIILPDMTVDGAFDAALQDVTYVLHVGSPVPVPGFDPVTQVWEPTIKGMSSLLTSALQVPSIKRVVITSSIVGNMPPMPDPSTTVTAATRVHLPGPPPKSFSNLFEAYALGKITQVIETDAFIEKNQPHFSVANIMPGCVYGRNELKLTAHGVLDENSSNRYLMACITGTELPFPVHGGYIHIDDLADIHLKVLRLEPGPGTIGNFGACINIDYSGTFGHVAKAFPKAVADGTFKRGNMPTLPMSYDSSETEKVLGIKFRPFEDAVVDTARQYLEKLGKELA